MKLRKFLTLILLSTGAFFVLSNQNVTAQGNACVSVRTQCQSGCTQNWQQSSQTPWDYETYGRCWASCIAYHEACYSAVQWQNWLWQVNLNIGDNFLILNEPNPMCAYYPDMLVNCGSLPTAEEIEACMLMVQQEQARDNCP